jgi:hypothetical protein
VNLLKDGETDDDGNRMTSIILYPKDNKENPLD